MIDTYTLKIGEKVRIINNDNGNGFRIGEIVTKIGMQEDNKFVNENGEEWYVSDCSCELVEEAKKTTVKEGDFVRILKKEHIFTGELKWYGDKCIGQKGYFTGGAVWKKMENNGEGYGEYYGLFTSDELELVESCDSCEVNSGNVQEMINNCVSKLKINNEPINSSRNKVEKIMSNITKFVKESFLSADEKLLRKVGLKDSCGDYTDEAEVLVTQKLLRENEAYLVESAKAMEAEEKANK